MGCGQHIGSTAWHAWGSGFHPQHVSKGETRLLLSGKDLDRMPKSIVLKRVEQIAEMLSGGEDTDSVE